MTTHTTQQGRVALLVALFAVLASIYMLVYSGYIESGDSKILFNAAGSFYRFGDFRIDLMMNERLPASFDATEPNPLLAVNAEPLPVVLASGLYALANAVPGLGLVHTVWLFNVIVVALSGCVFFLFAEALGYDRRTALWAALAFGLATIVLPYSKTFLREPLTLLTILLAAYAAERARASGYRLVWLIGLALAVGAMLITRAAAAFALPAILVIVLPEVRGNAGRVIGLALLLVGIAAGVFLLANLFGGNVVGDRYDLFGRMGADRAYLLTAVHGYLLSIGGSVWATSPVTLLAIPGAYLLLRKRMPRYPLAALFVLLSFAFGYAVLSGQHWFGGLSWPPRPMIPVVPFLMLAALPVFARMRQRGWLLVVFVMSAFSLWVQVTAVSVRWGAYAAALPPESGGLIEWSGGLNLVQYLRWVVIPGLWGSVPLDSAWARAGLPFAALAFAALALIAGLWLRRLILRPARVGGSLALVLAWIGLTLLALRALYDVDPLYNAGNDALRAIVPIIEQETTSEDILFLSNPAYVDFFFNYGKWGDAARLIGLPPHPGDRPSPEQAPEVSAENPDIQIKMQAITFIYALARGHDHLWLLENFGPALPWSVRPVEGFMAAHYYPLRTLETAPQVRLIEFVTVDAPDPFGFRLPETTTDLVFGDDIALTGVDLPRGTSYLPGSALPISLVWRAHAPLDRDYTIGLYLRAADGSPVAQVDSPPRWGFAPTSRWHPGAPIWDHRALRLPPDLPSGDYQLWVKVYGFNDDLQAQDLPVTGASTIDGAIGVLPVTITVRVVS
ncbi:MAG: hypothetical protein IT320_20330 [Anaerolineae bacterium]|nr:hypothetical protein [Anaerolineae bacterium]